MGTSDGRDEDIDEAELIELADRWRRAGRALRRAKPERFLRHLEALEHACAEAGAVEQSQEHRLPI